VTKVVIAYGTTEGHTTKIADYLAAALRSHGCEADIRDIQRSGGMLPDGYDAVIVGGSIHMGKHKDAVRDFVRQNRAALERLPSAFFSVSLAASGDPENANAYVARFEQETGWRPAQVGLFGGALPYTQYGFIKRHMMVRIVRSKPGNLSTDTSRDWVYTDWDQVQQFADAFLTRLASEGAARATT
jgi:menaquinone-dependent protoporphyrinogen oxidase